MDPNSILGQIMMQVGQPAAQAPQPGPSTFQPISDMLNRPRVFGNQSEMLRYGRPDDPTDGQGQYNAALSDQRWLETMRQTFGPPPANANTYDLQRAWYTQLMRPSYQGPFGRQPRQAYEQMMQSPEAYRAYLPQLLGQR